MSEKSCFARSPPLPDLEATRSPPVSQPPTRIAFCVTDLDPGGAERALVQLAAGLNREQWEPRVYCLGPTGALVERLEEAGIPVECLGARSIRNVGVVIRLARRLRAFQPAILQTFLFHANLAGRVAGTLARVPVIVCGIRVAERQHRWHLLLDRWTQALVTHNVCVSRAVADFSLKRGRLREDKLSVIPNGVDGNRFAQAAPADLTTFGIPTGSRVILSVGRLHPQKGHDLLISAAAPLLKDRPDVHVLIVGEGPSRADLASQIASLDGREQFHLVGWQSDIPGLMKASTVFALPSRWEGMPNVVLEAMAAGLPVVATDVEGIRDVLRDGLTGLIVPSENPDELCNRVRTLLDDAALHTRIARESQVHSNKEFTTESVCHKYDLLYQELLARESSLNT